MCPSLRVSDKSAVFFPYPAPLIRLSLLSFVILTAAFGHNECPDPGIPINARRFGDSFQLGSSISVVCEDGFIKTQGSETVSCQLERGKVMWSGPIPKCEGKHRLMAAEGKKNIFQPKSCSGELVREGERTEGRVSQPQLPANN